MRWTQTYGMLVGVVAVLLATKPEPETLRRDLKERQREEYRRSFGDAGAEILSTVRATMDPSLLHTDSFGVLAVAKLGTGEVYLGALGAWTLLPRAVGDALPLDGAFVRGRFFPSSVAGALTLLSVVAFVLLKSRDYSHWVQDHFIAGARVFDSGRLHSFFTAALYHGSGSHLFSDLLHLYVSALNSADALGLSGPNFLRLCIGAAGMANLFASAAQFFSDRRQRYAGFASGLFPTGLALLALMARRRPHATLMWFGITMKPVHALFIQIAFETLVLRGSLFPALPACVGASLSGYLFHFYLRFGLYHMFEMAYEDAVMFLETGNVR